METVDGRWRILADLDEVAVGIAHVATPFRAVIVQGLGEEDGAFFAPLFVAGPDVGDAQVEEAAYAMGIRRSFEKDFWLVGSGAAAGIENEPGVRQLDVAGIFGFDYFAAQNADVEVFGFLLVAHGEEVRDEEAFAGDGCIGEIHGAPLVVENTMRRETSWG